MKNAQYGLYDFNSIGEHVKSRKVYGNEYRIDRESQSFHGIHIKNSEGGNVSDRGLFKGIDSAILIINRVNQLKDDIERYKKMGKVKDGYFNNVYTDFRKLIPAVEKEIQKLYEYL